MGLEGFHIHEVVLGLSGSGPDNWKLECRFWGWGKTGLPGEKHLYLHLSVFLIAPLWSTKLMSGWFLSVARWSISSFWIRKRHLDSRDKIMFIWRCTMTWSIPTVLSPKCKKSTPRSGSFFYFWFFFISSMALSFSFLPFPLFLSHFIPTHAHPMDRIFNLLLSSSGFGSKHCDNRKFHSAMYLKVFPKQENGRVIFHRHGCFTDSFSI